MHLFSFILWNFDPTFFTLNLSGIGLGVYPIRWYGLLFALGFLISQQVMFYVYKTEAGTDLAKRKEAEKFVESLTVYMIVATIIGARLGHVLFYQPMDYLTHPWRILNLREGGLASHGGAIGILFALWLFSKYRINTKKGSKTGLFLIKTDRGYNYLQILDRIVIVVALTGALIRMGNFANSEIIGKPTHSDWGVVFGHEVKEALTYDPSGTGWIEDVSFDKDDSRQMEEGHVPIVLDITFKKNGYQEEQLESFLNSGINRALARSSDHVYEPQEHPLDYTLTQKQGQYMASVKTYGVARQPSQLYESASSFLLFLFLFYLWSRRKKETPDGLLIGLFLVILFTLRFVYEFTKENQVAFEDHMALNMGQWLSIPFVLIGIIVLVRAFRKKGAGLTT